MATGLYRSFRNPSDDDAITRQMVEDVLDAHRDARAGREHEPFDAADTERLQKLAMFMVMPDKAPIATPLILAVYPQMAELLQPKVQQ